jgi:Zn ribbon nucleic-acid-binding protein
MRHYWLQKTGESGLKMAERELSFANCPTCGEESSVVVYESDYESTEYCMDCNYRKEK